MTGATGHVGGRLLALLLDDPEIDRIRTVARGDVPAHPKIHHTRADLTAREARDALDGVDVLWHLGAQLWRSRDGRQIDVNLAGTANVLAARPAHIVFASSAAVYGAHPDNPVPITEALAPRPNAECPYAWHKLEAERMCAEATATTVVRICAVLGAHADRRVARATMGYKAAVPALRRTRQAMQFIDEDDAAAGLFAAGRSPDVGGCFNLATEDWLSAEAIADISGGRVIALPRRLAIAASELGFRLRVLPFGADRSSLLGGPLALDPSHAIAEFGWKPTMTSAAVLGRALQPAQPPRAQPAPERPAQTAR
ncbi:MAG: NAD-dependent epimerase/dehydratase family protein [Acidimicrobiales bacterium]